MTASSAGHTYEAGSLRAPWWKTGVIYQVYPRSFQDANGDGIGDLQGILERLDYLNDGTEASLGIDAIWLNPIYPSPMADFGYDISNYCDVHGIFGDMATFDSLLQGCHARGIKVILDFVPNHSSNQHPWFLESRSDRRNPKRDWYIWRNPRPDGSLPNNWGSNFGGPAWEWDDGTRQYYYHQFLKQQPDLNWRNPQVRQAMFDVLRFWLDRGVDGFRMDVVGMILKHPAMPDQPPDPAASGSLPANDLYNRQLHLYDQDQVEVHELIREMRGLLDDYKDRCAIGEVWYELPRWVRYYGEEGNELHLPFNFRLIDVPWQAASIRQAVNELEEALPSFAWPNYVLGNHDCPRLASRIGREQTRLAAMLLLTLRGTPTLYYGDEIGLENGSISADRMQDPWGLRLGAGHNRDVCRTPMQWDTSPHAGFTSGEPWLPVSVNYPTHNVYQYHQDPGSLLNLYRRLIWLRRCSPVLQLGSYQPFEINTPDSYIYIRQIDSERWLIALNFGDRPAIVRVNSGKVNVLLSTCMDRRGSEPGNRLELRGHEGVIAQIG